MKTYFYLFILWLGITSCSDFLEYNPEDFTAPPNWYSNQEELEMSLAATYNYLRDSYDMNLAVFFPMGNDLYFDRASSSIAEKVHFFTHSTSNGDVSGTWQQLYKGINNANMFLEYADNARGNVSDPIIDYMKGETLFLRAYYTFILTAYWGDVPLRLKSTSSAAEGHLAVSAQAVIFEQIVEDLKEALDMLPSIQYYNFGGRASKSAAKGMLVRVCLHAAGRLKQASYYEDARTWAKSLMNDGIHSLNESFSDVFVTLMLDQYDIKESIFEVEAWGNVSDITYRETGGWSCYFTPQFGGLGDLQCIPILDSELFISRGRNTVVTTPYFRSLYEPEDQRQDWTISTQLYVNNSDPAQFNDYNPDFNFRYPGKFRRIYEVPPIYTWGNSTNYPILRYSDVLLMFAEADNEVNNGPSAEAVEALNMVRRRGYGRQASVPNASVDISSSLSHDDFLKVVQEERARELAFEGHRKLDLIRWGILVEQLRAVGDEILSFPLQVPDPNGSGNIPNPAVIQNGSGLSQDMNDLVVTFQNVSERHYLMPIPEIEVTTNREIDKNNPGW